MNVNFGWLTKSGVFVCRNPWENVTYEWVLTVVPSMSWMICKMERKWHYNRCFVWCSFQDALSLFSPYLDFFSPSVLLESKWNWHCDSLENSPFYFIREIRFPHGRGFTQHILSSDNWVKKTKDKLNVNSPKQPFVRLKNLQLLEFLRRSFY